jgi:nicotinamidase/pyrazinamidase
LRPRRGRSPLRQAASDAFTNPALDDWLREHDVGKIVITGLFAPHCIRATVRGALGRGYGVTIVSDGLGAASERSRASAIKKMQRDGATVTTSSALRATQSS